MSSDKKIKLYTYWRSSSAYRVRIALNLKGLDYESIPIHLVKDGGEQHADAYKELNPQELIPTLIDGDVVLSQSLAIMEYLDEAYPDTPSLLSMDTVARAKIRSLALIVATDIQPLDNLRVLQYLKNTMQVSDEQKTQWYAHWIVKGFEAYEAMLNDQDTYSFADQPSLADACLIPQIYNADRFDIDLSWYPNILKIRDNCMQLDAFDNAKPENQPDAVKPVIL